MFSWLTSFFSNPALLAGTSAGAIPVIIHLLNKQRFKRVIWAAMHWLWAAQKKASRRLRIEELILLLIRILILVLLALALARPALQEGMGLLGGRASVYRVVLLDNSFSMGRLVGGKTLFSKAKDVATQLVESLTPSDELDVLLANTGVEELTTGSLQKRAEVIRDLKAAPLSDAATHLPRAIAGACKLILERKSKNLRKELILVTDQTRSAWESAGQPKKLDAADEDAVREVFQDPRTKPKLWIVRLPGGDSRENLALTGLEIEEKVVTVNAETQFAATVVNYGKTPAKDVSVTLLVDGEKVGHETIALAEPLKPATAFLRHTFPVSGSHAVTAALREDDLPPDNTAALALDVEEQVRVLCVDGQQQREPNASELDFFRQALSPTRVEEVQAGRMPLYPEVVSDGAFPDMALDRFRLVVLGNVALIPPEKVLQMEQFVKQGGALWFWLGDRIDPALANKDLGALLPATLGEAVGAGSPEAPGEALSDKEAEHPAVRRFRHIKGLPLSQLIVYRRFKLTPKKSAAGAPARTVLAVENGEPLAMEWKLGEGRVLLIATTADKAWCNWPAKNHYMPLVNFLALDLIQPAHALRNRLVGESFGYKIAGQELGAIRREGLRLNGPDGEPVPMDVVAESFSAYSKPVKKAGIYSAEIPGETRRTLHFAANRVPEESDLDSIAESEIRASFPLEDGGATERNRFFEAPVLQGDVEFPPDDPAQIEAALRKHVSGREIWRWLIGGVLVLLLVESVLAKRFGDPNR